MVRDRIYGSDTAFCAWMRSCKSLPAFDKDFGFVAADNDLTVHRYMTSVDGVGTRDVQCIMQIEVKTRRGKPSASQTDTLSKLNIFQSVKQCDGVIVRFFGVFFLVLENETPDNSQRMWWGSMPSDRFITDAKQANWRCIDRETLVSLLRFEKHPGNLTVAPLRRHHKRNEYTESVVTPLGFSVDKLIVKRS